MNHDTPHPEQTPEERVDQIVARVHINSSKGLTRVGLKQAIFVTELLKIVRDPEQSYDEILQLVLETYGVEKA